MFLRFLKLKEGLEMLVLPCVQNDEDSFMMGNKLILNPTSKMPSATYFSYAWAMAEGVRKGNLIVTEYSEIGSGVKNVGFEERDDDATGFNVSSSNELWTILKSRYKTGYSKLTLLEGSANYVGTFINRFVEDRFAMKSDDPSKFKDYTWLALLTEEIRAGFVQYYVSNRDRLNSSSAKTAENLFKEIGMGHFYLHEDDLLAAARYVKANYEVSDYKMSCVLRGIRALSVDGSDAFNREIDAILESV